MNADGRRPPFTTRGSGYQPTSGDKAPDNPPHGGSAGKREERFHEGGYVVIVDEATSWDWRRSAGEFVLPRSLNIMERHIDDERRNHWRRSEDVLREMLGRWASELEPAAVYRDYKLLGLCVADDPTSAIIVRPANG